MAPRRSTAVSKRERPLALAYSRVSTSEQATDGASLAAQQSALTAEAQRRGWDVEHVIDAGVSGKDLDGRPDLVDALARLDRGEADILLAVRTDRVSRSTHDFTGLVKRAIGRGGTSTCSTNPDSTSRRRPADSWRPRWRPWASWNAD